MTRWAMALAMVVSLYGAGSAPALAQVTVGQYDAGNCYPFACAAGDGVTTYQQFYSSSAFNGSLNFSSLSFFQDSLGQIDSASYNVSFYYAATNALDTDPALNRGASIGNFGDFTLGGAMPQVLTLNGATLTYDPTLGNLLMDVSIHDVTNTVGYASFFQADYTGTSTSRFYGSGGVGTVGDGALVTRFGTTGAAPEPAAWAMMILGFGIAGAALRRRQISRPLRAFDMA